MSFWSQRLLHLDNDLKELHNVPNETRKKLIAILRQHLKLLRNHESGRKLQPARRRSSARTVPHASSVDLSCSDFGIPLRHSASQSQPNVVPGQGRPNTTFRQPEQFVTVEGQRPGARVYEIAAHAREAGSIACSGEDVERGNEQPSNLDQPSNANGASETLLIEASIQNVGSASALKALKAALNEEHRFQVDTSCYGVYKNAQTSRQMWCKGEMCYRLFAVDYANHLLKDAECLRVIGERIRTLKKSRRLYDRKNEEIKELESRNSCFIHIVRLRATPGLLFKPLSMLSPVAIQCLL